ncbi:hypothetical protein [Chitinophaga sp.]|uniref:hypothetical protein n=1 Tax=Chitinophaga sp. TaxID=1869181 RepID=UPI0031CFEF82
MVRSTCCPFTGGVCGEDGGGVDGGGVEGCSAGGVGGGGGVEGSFGMFGRSGGGGIVGSSGMFLGAAQLAATNNSAMAAPCSFLKFFMVKILVPLLALSRRKWLGGFCTVYFLRLARRDPLAGGVMIYGATAQQYAESKH